MVGDTINTNNKQQPPACHCGKPLAFDDCCRPIINGNTTAKTAEQLMRSRYSAFCHGAVDYLINTHHAPKRSDDEHAGLEETIRNNQWQHLTILNKQHGLESDDRGRVEFIAAYLQNNHLHWLHENSSFVKENGQWLYVDGDIIDSADEKNPKHGLGRNDICWCGSGKKVKKCHG